MALLNSPSLKDELKNNKELKESDINLLKDWNKKQPHLPILSDYELILFLHSNYYRTEPTKTTIEAFFTIKTHVPEIFSNRDPLSNKELREIMNVVCYILLPGTTSDGYRVIYASLIDSDPSRYVFVNAVKLLTMFTENCLNSLGTCPGFIIMIDMKGAVFGHVARLNPMIMKKYLYYLQEALPIRLKGFQFINSVPFMDAILNIMKPFMKNELMDMLSVHTGENKIDNKIPIDILPNELGGKAGSKSDLWKSETRNLENNRAWFQENENRKVNEALRPGKAKNVTDIFGVEGSFKKLDID